jgi:hypothetical protein
VSIAATTAVSGPGIMPNSVKLTPLPDTYLRWMRRNVSPQKQDGYCHVTVRLPLGDFTAGQMRVLADLADAPRVCDRAMFVQSIRHRQRLAVIGYREVLESRLPRGQGHRFDVFPAIGLGRMAVKVAADIAERHELGQPPVFRGFDLAAALAQLGRNVGQAQRCVDLRFSASGHHRPVAAKYWTPVRGRECAPEQER